MTSASSASSPSSSGAGSRCGIENDAAELAGGRVLTQDALVEGVHFRLDWISWRELGFRAAAVNLSDLAASGAEPEGLVVTLAAPSDTAVADVVELYEGLAEPGVPVIGGDTTAADRPRPERDRGRPVASASPAGRARGRATCSSSPGRSARPGRRFGPGGTRRPPLRLEEGRAPRRASRTRWSTSRTGSPATPVTSPAARAAAS